MLRELFNFKYTFPLYNNTLATVRHFDELQYLGDSADMIKFIG